MSAHHGLSAEEFFSGITTSTLDIRDVDVLIEGCRFIIQVERISDTDNNTQYRCVRSTNFRLRTWLWDKTQISIKVRLLGSRSESTDRLDDELMEELITNPTVFQDVVRCIAFHPDLPKPQFSLRRRALEDMASKTIVVNFFVRHRGPMTIQVGLQLKAGEKILMNSVTDPIDQGVALSTMSKMLEPINQKLEVFAKEVEQPVSV